MKPFTTVTGKVCPLDYANVDTDQIIPKQFLKRIERTGYGQYLFYDWRFDHDGKTLSSFPLNQEAYKDASILLTGPNFGCGSSREHAPWALSDFGIRAIISPSFADIFYQNCLKNGLLPITLDEQTVEKLMNKAKEEPIIMTIQLEEQQIFVDGLTPITFTIDPYWKQMLVNGWDEIQLTLNYESYISSYENKSTLGR
ncbi:3-isopropylmalate dehydratase small subunit [Aeribacillus pallidus]|uniref:3-isopropylmalate dehydratase small subunit n=1 Tax=Aeribacillus pallidus TaxID=33936 RepID=UPI003D1A503D